MIAWARRLLKYQGTLRFLPCWVRAEGVSSVDRRQAGEMWRLGSSHVPLWKRLPARAGPGDRMAFGVQKWGGGRRAPPTGPPPPRGRPRPPPPPSSPHPWIPPPPAAAAAQPAPPAATAS